MHWVEPFSLYVCYCCFCVYNVCMERVRFWLLGISCIFEGRHKIGIVGWTDSGRTTHIGALVDSIEWTIIIDDIDISITGLYDLRSRLVVMAQNLWSSQTQSDLVDCFLTYSIQMDSSKPYGFFNQPDRFTYLYSSIQYLVVNSLPF